MSEIIEGKKHAVEIRTRLRGQIAKLAEKHRSPSLAVIVAGAEAASLYYAKLIKKAGGKEGVKVAVDHIENPRSGEVIEKIKTLNTDTGTDGILLQLPLPDNLDKEKIINSISPQKDVDGQHPLNLGCLLAGVEGMQPATARAVVKILKLNGIKIKGKKVVVVGRSTAVGLPAAIMLLKEDAALSVCHSKTKPLENFTRGADILVVSAGRPNLIGPGHVREGAAVIDVGTNDLDGKMVGDVNYSEVIKKASVSPVTGGVGALTMACLLENTFNAYKKNIHHNPAQQ